MSLFTCSDTVPLYQWPLSFYSGQNLTPNINNQHPEQTLSTLEEASPKRYHKDTAAIIKQIFHEILNTKCFIISFEDLNKEEFYNHISPNSPRSLPSDFFSNHVIVEDDVLANTKDVTYTTETNSKVYFSTNKRTLKSAIKRLNAHREKELSNGDEIRIFKLVKFSK